MGNEQIVQMREMRNNGATYMGISATLDIPYTTVYETLNPKAKERKRARVIEWCNTHRKERRLYDIEWYKTHKEKKCLYNAEYQKAHKEEKHLRNAKWYKKHKKRILLRKSKYRKTHLSEDAARSAAKYALILGATIGNLAEIKEIYRQAKEDKRVRCYLCGKLIPVGHRHVDHITPLSKRGAHRPSNLAGACDECNLHKHDKMPEDMGVLL